MTVLAGYEPSPTAAAHCPAPFVVAGVVRGRAVRAAAQTLDDVLDRIGLWTESDRDATGHWGLHPDYSEPLVLAIRLRAGAERLSRRAAHLVRLSPGVRYGGLLAAVCGGRFAITDTETVEVGRGMPCELCLAGAPLFSVSRQAAEADFTRSNAQSLTASRTIPAALL